MTHPNLLVELFVEELPPKALQKLGDAFGAVPNRPAGPSDSSGSHSPHAN